LSRTLFETEHSPLLVKYVALLLALLAVMAFGVRPALRRAAAGGGKASTEAAREIGTATKAALAAPATLPDDPERTRAQDIFEQVSGHLKREPAQSSRLLQSWIHSE
jgi:flagellar M-ring protein FliF